MVALTFDSNMTAFMLGELDRHRVRSFDNTAVIDELIRLRVPATFFLSGLWMERYPAETRRLASVPFFELGSHSYAHRGFTPHCYGLGRLPAAGMTADILRSEQVLAHFDPHPTRLFRFPGGCMDPVARRAAQAAHVVVVQYDVAGGDAFGRSVGQIVRHTLSATRNGSVVVLHITGGNTAPLTAFALPRIVAGLRARGLTLVTVSTLMSPVPPRTRRS
jgi:peptidoglycan/xylan/chitin deacetylase (PgdA/CDA1 family)